MAVTADPHTHTDPAAAAAAAEAVRIHGTSLVNCARERASECQTPASKQLELEHADGRTDGRPGRQHRLV